MGARECEVGVGVGKEEEVERTGDQIDDVFKRAGDAPTFYTLPGHFLHTVHSMLVL